MSLDILDMATSDILALIPRCIDFISTGERHPMQAVFTACACVTRALVAWCSTGVRWCASSLCVRTIAERFHHRRYVTP